MMGFGLILVLLIVGAVAYASGWRPSWGQGITNPGSRPAMDIVRERYARGEITADQYREMRDELSR
jgi:uncharacterized membrane protein